jgi:hypothetical protein
MADTVFLLNPAENQLAPWGLGLEYSNGEQVAWHSFGVMARCLAGVRGMAIAGSSGRASQSFQQMRNVYVHRRDRKMAVGQHE